MHIRFYCLFICLLMGCSTLGIKAEDHSRLFEKLKPTVVVVEAEKSVSMLTQEGEGFVDQSGLGSGVIVDKQKVLTAAHVVHTADAIIVHLYDGQKIPAKVIASSPATDVALLELETVPKNVQVAKVGDSDKAKTGAEVLVIGAPYGLAYTLTVGHISNRLQLPEVTNRLVPLELFQTDAAINQGNSGGPMFNTQGEVIGVVSHILSKSGGFEGLGFATTTAVAKETLIDRAGIWTGAQAQVLTGTACEIFNVPQSACLLITDMAKGSLAENLGLRSGSIPATIADQPLMLGGDIVLSVGGITIEDMTSLQKINDYIRAFKLGQTFKVTVWRNGERLELSYQTESK